MKNKIKQLTELQETITSIKERSIELNTKVKMLEEDAEKYGIESFDKIPKLLETISKDVDKMNAQLEKGLMNLKNMICWRFRKYQPITGSVICGYLSKFAA